jgi:pyocin activator protein PrtN
MSSTETTLLAKFGAPVVRLTDICEEFLAIGADRAKRRANMNSLPFPAFPLDPAMHKSPWMVMVADIAEYLDAQAATARKSWELSQV